MDPVGYGRAAFLGVVQGLTEFLPISSDGHLIVAERLLGIDGPTLMLNVVLHGGTLAAVLLFYAKDLGRLLAALGRVPRKGWAAEAETRLVGLLLLASVPTGIIGLLLKDPVENRLSTIYWAGAGFLVTASALMFSRSARGFSAGARTAAAMRLRDALAIGAVQGAAVLPGVSRSGLTISTALGLGIGPAEAARFSFLLAIPAIAGALVLELRHGIPAGASPGPLLAGAAASFVTGWIALKLLVGLLSRGRFAEFALYLIPLGIACIVYGWGRV